MTGPLIGYCDPLTVRPGQRVRFMLGSGAGELNYEATFTRLVCADVQVNGAGFHEEPADGASAVRGAAVPQRVDPVRVPVAMSLGGTDAHSCAAPRGHIRRRQSSHPNEGGLRRRVEHHELHPQGSGHQVEDHESQRDKCRLGARTKTTSLRYGGSLAARRPRVTIREDGKAHAGGKA